MKQILLLWTLLSFLLSLTACGLTGGRALPEQTGELVVYDCSLLFESNFNNALRMFKEKYPDVNFVAEKFEFGVTYATGGTAPIIGSEIEDVKRRATEFQNRVITELMAGEGPDIIVWDTGGSVFGDIQKVMGVGIFDDLNPYLAADETFSYDDFLGEVFDAGIRGEERLFLPINYRVPIKLTSDKMLDMWDIKLVENMTFDEYSAVLKRVYEQMEIDDSRWMHSYDSGRLDSYLENYGGFRYVDYENGEVTVDSSRLKSFLDAYGPFHTLLEERAADGKAAPFPFVGDESASLSGKVFEYEFPFMSMEQPVLRCNSLIDSGQTPVLYGVPLAGAEKNAAYTEMCAAIGRNSENKANAYEFLKLLLSDEAYAAENFFLTPIPVRKQSAKRFFLNFAAPFIRDGSLWNPVVEKYLSTISDVELVNQNTVVLAMVEESMLPYVEGEKPYDECFEELVNKLKFYVSE